MRPNFLVIGAAKSGTTAVYDHLAQHPDIFLPALKEPHFLGFHPDSPTDPDGGNRGPIDGTEGQVVASPEEYLALFDGAGARSRVGECATSILALAERSVENIAEFCAPDVKMIAVLRHPIDRAYSSFNHARRVGIEPHDDFRRALQAEAETIAANGPMLMRYMAVSDYARQLRAFFDAFGRDRVHVVLYDALQQAESAVIDDMVRFLDLDPVPTESGTPANASFVPDASRPVRNLIYRGVLRARPLGRLVPAAVQRRAGYLTRRTLLVKPQPLPADVRNELTDGWSAQIGDLEGLLDISLEHWRP